MQQPASVSWEPVIHRVAAALHVAADQLPPEWATLASIACKDASEDIISLLALKGYSAAQIASADQLASWVERRAYVLTMYRGTALANYDLTSVKLVDPYEMIERANAILINRQPVAPDTGATPVGGIGFGRLNAVDGRLPDFFPRRGNY